MPNLNETPTANRLHIGIFGCRNVGKSSLINAITNEEISIVSDVKGTTTDPVSKSMEILPLGPVVIFDTPGFDDDDKLLGEKRVERVKKILNKVDIALLVLSKENKPTNLDIDMEKLFIKNNIPYIIVINKCDLNNNLDLENYLKDITEKNNIIEVSSLNKINIEKLKNMLSKMKPNDNNKSLVGDIVKKDDLIILVTPIDSSAPKGRLILPQVQMIRDILDNDAIPIVTKENTLENLLKNLGRKPDFVITDSQVFKQVDDIVDKDIPLTSFSILLARYKGFLKTALKGVKAVKNIKDGDVILISEGCTHHRQCEDIGTVKIPNFLKKITNKNFHIETSSGNDFPDDLSKYKMVIHCGGCMVSEREMLYRMKCAMSQNIPFTNYGIFIAFATNVLDRSVKNIPIY